MQALILLERSNDAWPSGHSVHSKTYDPFEKLPKHIVRFVIVQKKRKKDTTRQ